MNLLLDTNVLIDHFGARPGFDDAAHKVMAIGLFGDANLWVCANSLVDAFYLLRKATDPHQLQCALSKALSVLNVCSVGQEDVSRALSQSWTDFEDCLISVCAKKVHADYIVTRDKDGFVQASTPFISPVGLLEIMEKEYGLNYDFATL